jgi:hypothetical protein
MTMHADYTATCDRCGADLGTAGLDRCVVISMIAADTTVTNLHLCTSGGRCAQRVLTTAALAHHDANEGVPGEHITPYDREKAEAEAVEPAPEPTPEPAVVAASSPRRRAHRAAKAT